MNQRILGRIKRVNGPVIEAKGISDARMLELVSVGESGLTGEVIKLSGTGAVIQVYEDPRAWLRMTPSTEPACRCPWNWGRVCWAPSTTASSGL